MLEEGFDDDYSWETEFRRPIKESTKTLVSFTKDTVFVGDLFINADKMSKIVIHKDDKKYTLEFDDLKRLTIKMDNL